MRTNLTLARTNLTLGRTNLTLGRTNFKRTNYLVCTKKNGLPVTIIIVRQNDYVWTYGMAETTRPSDS